MSEQRQKTSQNRQQNKANVKKQNMREIYFQNGILVHGLYWMGMAFSTHTASKDSLGTPKNICLD